MGLFFLSRKDFGCFLPSFPCLILSQCSWDNFFPNFIWLIFSPNPLGFGFPLLTLLSFSLRDLLFFNVGFDIPLVELEILSTI
jgi:hypothetical protein